ncbi:hypothetical protein P171DRAFT_209123 [Karstenula rhodostoma CBS 690.94]|uniref:Transcription factor Iwr1 domain-containing protein n=1 Tax=Karstenula rhodostoma CBS 690.94 TaxID=1392251 RepID=A0A9P4PS40_9PLEO|nr:hypothetical protein P171DRAFT_209123 [Karstenula rhodostoma CBS 690.94]
MAPQPPQTLSVKRKRNDAPVHHLVVDADRDRTIKRQKSAPRFTWRLLQKPGDNVPAALPSPTPQQNRRFHVSLSAGLRVLVEAPDLPNAAPTTAGETSSVPSIPEAAEPQDATRAPPATPRPRKRPGAAAAMRINPAYTAQSEGDANPSDEHVKHFEKLAEELEQEEQAQSKPAPSPVKYLPTGPARRSKKATALAVQDPDAMDVDEYVIDTYVREELMSDADGNIVKHEGIIGYIILKEEDEDWWNGEDESDREFDTDEDDENAEDYYANDYPEDELSSDDEFDRDPYQRKYRHGSDDEEYDLNDDAISGDEDDEHFRRLTVPGQAALLNRLGR